MAGNNRTTTNTLHINGSQARDELTALGKKAEELRKKIIDCNNVGDLKGMRKAQDELKKATKEATALRKAAFDVNTVLNNLSTAKPKELQRTLTELNRQMNSDAVVRGSKKWNELRDKITLVRTELQRVNQQTAASTSGMSRMANGFNKYFGMVTGAIATVTGLSFAFRKLSEDVAKMDDTYSDVMKTTGLTHEQVEDLNEAFKQMDTRTAREELNNLARDAGKLGITGKKDILDFVEAGNQINVALGEDLGEGAIKNIGKLTEVYKKSTEELDGLDLKGRMLSIGSAINELGQSSTASEGYLVDFAQRLGGIGAQAGLSIQNVLGFASALDQAGEKTEMSATAFQKLIMKMMSKPGEFAQIAGMEVSKFNDMIKNDMNQALVVVLKSLGGKGGLQQLIPIFKDMGLDAARAAEVVSSLATNIHLVTEAQDISNKAFSEATSLTNEYNVKNNNLKAKLEKARKEFKESALELGARLNPALLTSTNSLTYIIKMMPSVINFFSKYGSTLVKLAVVMGVYVATTKLAAFWQKKYVDATIASIVQDKLATTWLTTKAVAQAALNLVIAIFTGNLKKAKEAWIAMAGVMKASSLGALLAVITALGVAIYSFISKANEAKKTMREFNAELELEKQKATELFEAYKRANAGTDERKRILEELKAKYGPYLKNLINEYGYITNIENAQLAVNRALEQQIALKYKNQKTDDFLKGTIDKQIKAQEGIEAIFKANIKNEALAEKTYNKFLEAVKSKNNKTIREITDSLKKGWKSSSDSKFLWDYYLDFKAVVEEQEEGLKKIDSQFKPFIKEDDAQKSLSDMDKIIKKINELTTALNTAETKETKIDIQKQINAQNELLKPYKERQHILDEIAKTEKEIQDLKEGYSLIPSTQQHEAKQKIQEKEKYLDGLKGKINPSTETTIGDYAPEEKESEKAKKLRLALKAEEDRYKNAQAKAKEEYLKTLQGEAKTDYNMRLEAEKAFNQKMEDLQLETLKNQKEIKKGENTGDIDNQIQDIEIKKIEKELQLLEQLEGVYDQFELKAQDKNAVALVKLSQQVEKAKKIIDNAEKANIINKEQAAKLKEEIEENSCKAQEKLMVDENAKYAAEQMKKLDEEEARQKEAIAKEFKDESTRKEALLKLEAEFLQKKLSLTTLSPEQQQELKIKVSENNAETEEGRKKDRADAEGKYNLVSLEELKRRELEIVDDYEKRKIISEEEAAEARLVVQQNYLDGLVGKMSEAYGKIENVTNNLSTAINNAQQAEEMAVENKYKKLIKSAKGNAAEQERLEEEKEAKTQAIRARYADKQFIIMVAQTIASTALAAMQSYAALAGIYPVGPVLGALAAAAAVAAGATQIAVAKQQHEAAKQGYASGGFTPNGPWYEEQGPVHSEEFVGNRFAVRNPAVRKVFNVVDHAQRNNTISSLTESDLVSGLSVKTAENQYAERRSQTQSNRQASYEDNTQTFLGIIDKQNAAIEKLNKRLDEPIVAETYMLGKRGIKETTDLYNKMKKNITRK